MSLYTENFDAAADVPAVDVLDVTDDQELMRKLLDTMKLLNQFQVTFDDERAVCQAQIKTLMDECEISLDHRYPIKSFTQEPSPTNLQAATESVFRRAGTAVVDFIRKILEVMRKILTWIGKAIKSLFTRQRGTHARVVMTKHLAEANLEVKSVVDPLSEDSDEIHAAKDALEQAVSHYADFYSELAHALLTQSPYLGAMKATSLFVPKLAGLMDAKLKLAETSLSHAGNEPSILRGELTELATPMPLIKLEDVARTFAPLKGKDTMLDYFEALKQLTAQMHDSHPKGQMDWLIAAAMIIDPRSGFDEPVIALPDAIQASFQSLLNRVDNVGRLDAPSKLDPSLLHLYEKAMMSLLSDVHALAMYVEAANVVLDTQASLATSLYQCHLALFSLNRAKVKDSNDATAVNAVNEIGRAHV